VATNVLEAVIISSPGFIPIDLRDNFIASVPELTPTAYFDPISLANFLSNISSSLPYVKSPVSTNFFNFFHRSLALENCCFK